MRRRRTLVIILAVFTLMAGAVGCSAKDTGHDKESVKDDATDHTAESEHANSGQTKTSQKTQQIRKLRLPPLTNLKFFLSVQLLLAK